MQIKQVFLQVFKVLPLRPMIRILIQIPKETSVLLRPISKFGRQGNNSNLFFLFLQEKITSFGVAPSVDLSLRGATNGRDAAIHRVSRCAYGGDAVRLPVHSGSPRAFLNALAMDNTLFREHAEVMRCSVLHDSVIARNNVTRQSIVPRGTRTESAVRLVVHSGSPRATPSR